MGEMADANVMYPEVTIINGPSGVVLGRSGELLLIQVGTGLNSFRVLVLESQVEGTPQLDGVPELGLGGLITYLN